MGNVKSEGLVVSETNGAVIARVPWTPTAGYVIVRQIKDADKTSGGIVIPETARKVTNTAYIIKVAEPTPEHEVLFKPGQQVIIGNPVGVAFEHEKETYIIISQYDCRGYIK